MTKILKHKNTFLLLAIATFILLLWQWRVQDELWQMGISAFFVGFWLFRYLTAPPPQSKQVAVISYLVACGSPRHALDIADATRQGLGSLYVTLHYLEKKGIIERTEGDDPSLAFYGIKLD